MKKIATDTKHAIVFSLKLLIILALAITLMLVSITKLNLHDDEPLLHFYHLAEFSGAEVLIFITFIGTIFLILFSIFVLFTDMFVGLFALVSLLIFFSSISANIYSHSVGTIIISSILFIVTALSVSIKYIEYLYIDNRKE